MKVDMAVVVGGLDTLAEEVEVEVEVGAGIEVVDDADSPANSCIH